MASLVAGSNIFGQWKCNSDPILWTFTSLDLPKNYIGNNTTKIVDITWSYNILQEGEDIIISGSFNGHTNTVTNIKLPTQISNRYLIKGNDHMLVLVNIDTFELWTYNFKEDPGWAYKSYLKEENDKGKIIKLIANMHSVFLLNHSGNVYELPVKMDTDKCIGTICDIQCGYEHNVLLSDQGGVYTCGNGRRCQLGHGDLNCIEKPTEVEALSGIKIVSIKTGGWHTLALSESGDLYAWGWNDTGQLGLKSVELKSQPVPVLVDFYDENVEVSVNVKDMVCGSKHSVVLLDDNTLWVAGSNKYGQLGLPSSVEMITSFRKLFQCKKDTLLYAGPWATVLVDKNN